MIEVDRQRHVAAMLLDVVGSTGFVLAGASAIREHGLTDRPTHDVDLFAFSTVTEADFSAAVDRAENELSTRGFAVSRVRSFPLFARLQVTDDDGVGLEVDFGVNWRAHAPSMLSVGPVLSESDAVAGKLSAVYSRREVRDFLDLDAIRASGRYSDADLLALGREHDDGFDRLRFAESLSVVVTFSPSEADEYGVDADAFAAMRDRIHAWAVDLRARDRDDHG